MKKDTKNDKNQKKKEKEPAKAKEPYNSSPYKEPVGKDRSAQKNNLMQRDKAQESPLKNRRTRPISAAPTVSHIARTKEKSTKQ